MLRSLQLGLYWEGRRRGISALRRCSGQAFRNRPRQPRRRRSGRCALRGRRLRRSPSSISAASLRKTGAMKCSFVPRRFAWKKCSRCGWCRRGASLFYGKTRRRTDVAFDGPLRELTVRLIGQLREMVDSRCTPAAVREKKCDRCSLLHLCLPEARPGTDAASRYLRRVLGQGLLAGTPAGD